MRDGVLRDARSLLEHHKKMLNQDAFTNIIIDTNRL